MDFITIAAVVVFLLIYALISFELINKTVAVLLGASIYLLAHVLNQERAFEMVDWNVIFLLVGMMIIVGITKQTGVFEFIAIRTAKAAKGEPVIILVAMMFITAFLSAFLDNVTTILILTPVSILIAVELGLSPVPFIISQAVASNIGGTATLIGDPPNIMIGSAADLSFTDFLVSLGPVVLVSLVVVAAIFMVFFRKRLRVGNDRKARIMEFDVSRSIKNRPLLVKSLSVLGLVIFGFLVHGAVDVEPATIAIAGASVLMLLAERHETDAFFDEVEWGTIFFFIGLFILVGGLVELGVIKRLSQLVLTATKGNVELTGFSILWASGLLSSFLDNIPYVATMIPLLQDMAPQIGPDKMEPIWWALSMGACFGGNGTLIGASANVVSAGIAGKSGYKISFLQFTKYGFLIMLLTLLIASGDLVVRFFM
ncbi:MAG: ArsB/NhaD family transporter [Alkalispirochaeta sp.]